MNNLFSDDDDRESFRVVAVLVAMHGILSADPAVRLSPKFVADQSVANADAIVEKLDGEATEPRSPPGQ